MTKLAALGGVGALGYGTGAVGARSAGPAGGGVQEAPLPQQGPDALYADLPTAPQLENTGGWAADPIMVSGTDAYVDGEYLYQDFVYDDHGANVTDTPLTQDQRPEPSYNYYSPTTGDYRYPTDFETYGYNAADLLEFRARPVEDGVAYRFTLQTMKAPDTAAIAVGINTDGEAGGGVEWGYGIGDLGDLGLDHVLVTWGTGAALDGEALADDRVSVDPERNQIEVTVPLDPGESSWRHYTVTGLWDGENERFKPVDGEPDADTPGRVGEARDPPLPPVFNVGFRFDESIASEEHPIIPEPPGDTTRADVLGYEQDPAPSVSGHWREHRQANALAVRDISEFYADIDFGRLAAGDTEYNVPESGFMDRLYVSGQSYGEGVETPAEGRPAEEHIFLNRVQPYAMYVPEAADAGEDGYPMHLFLHGSTSSYNEIRADQPGQMQQLGEQRGAVIVAPEGRGPSLGYLGRSMLDLFEAWRDARERVAIDATRVTVGGYSMGGFGSFNLIATYPGLFAKAFPIVGGSYPQIIPLLENVRNVPVLMWNSEQDSLVPPESFLPTSQRLTQLGYRHQLSLFGDVLPETDDHFYAGQRDEWGPAQSFLEGEYLGDASIDYTPPQVTYRRDPSLDVPDLGLVFDTAYWVSGIEVGEDADSGLVDVRSEAFGVAAPEPVEFEEEGTVPDPHQQRGVRWERPEESPEPANALDLTLEGVAAATVWAEAAGLSPDEPVTVRSESDTEATLTFTGSFGEQTLEIPTGETELTVELAASQDDGTETPDTPGGGMETTDAPGAGTTEGSGPGFGILGALAGVSALGYALGRNRGGEE